MIEWENKIIAYLNGDLSSEESQNLLLKIENSEKLKKLFLSYQCIESNLQNSIREKPSTQLSVNFYKNLDLLKNEERSTNQKAKEIAFRTLLKYAAASIVLFSAGLTLYNNFSGKPTKEQIAVSEILLEMETKTDTEKIKALYVDYQPTKSNQSKIKEVLIASLKNDKSSNVRLASVETLTDFIDDAKVRSALIRSLGIEEDPQVQIAIIMALSASNSEEAIKPLEQIINKEGGYKFVKDEAHVGIMNLTSI